MKNENFFILKPEQLRHFYLENDFTGSVQIGNCFKDREVNLIKSKTQKGTYILKIKERKLIK